MTETIKETLIKIKEVADKILEDVLSDEIKFDGINYTDWNKLY
jgi:hypothetical protein